MTRKMMVECDLCGGYHEEHTTYIMEMRPDLAQGQTGDVENWDVCPECRKVLLDFFRSRKGSDIPIIEVNQ